jgi:membrane protease YdiL (CAAX protease family)
MLKRHPILTYFILAYAISWLAVLALQVLARSAGLENFNQLMAMAETGFTLGALSGSLALPVPLVFLLTRIVDFGPSIAGLLTPILIGTPDEARDILRRLFNFRISGRWYAWALLLPAIIVSAALGLHLFFGDSAVTGAEWNGLATLGQLVFWVFLMRTMLGGGLGEELGWRGFALPADWRSFNWSESRARDAVNDDLATLRRLSAREACAEPAAAVSIEDPQAQGGG